jgi:molybdate transport system ATP-binding protein
MIDLALRLPLQAFSLEVSLRLEAPAVAVLGPSGAGKSSLLEAIAGLRTRATGRIVLDGEVLMDSDRGIFKTPESRRIGYVPQEGLLFPHLNVRDNIRFGLRRDGSRHSVEEISSTLEIGPLLPRYPSTLSGGERQRVALARALAVSPRLLLLDEPLAAIDVELKERIFPYLLRVRDQARIPIIYVTHQPGEARLLAQEALVLQTGRVTAHGPTRDVMGAEVMFRLDPRSSFENLLDGVIERPVGSDIVALRVGQLTIRVPGEPDLTDQSRALFTVPAEDLLLSTHSPRDISARNVFAGEVAAVHEIGADVFLSIGTLGYEWVAKLTAGAVRELSIQRGSKVFVVVKTHSFRRLR